LEAAGFTPGEYRTRPLAGVLQRLLLRLSNQAIPQSGQPVSRNRLPDFLRNKNGFNRVHPCVRPSRTRAKNVFAGFPMSYELMTAISKSYL
jgi:hypothetical protein